MATFEQIASGCHPNSWMPASGGGAWNGSALAEPDQGTLVGGETWLIDDTYDPASWEYGPEIPEAGRWRRILP
jgi:hypothetical protein